MNGIDSSTNTTVLGNTTHGGGSSHMFGLGHYGGGNCGFGLPAVGAIGLLDGHRGRDRDGDCDCQRHMLGMVADQIGQKIGTLSDTQTTQFVLTNHNINQGRTEEAIRDAKETLHNAAEHARTTFTGFAFGVEKSFGELKAGQERSDYRGELNTRDIISSQKDCCCETQKLIMEEGRLSRDVTKEEGRLTRDLLTANRMSDLEKENSRLYIDQSNLKQSHHFEHNMLCLASRLDKQDIYLQSIVGTGNVVGNKLNTGTNVGG